MKKHLTLLVAAFFSISLMAETYTIVFNSGNADSSSPTTELNNIVLSATDNCVESVLLANKIYRAKEGFGIKGGTGSAKGELTLGLDGTYHITTMTVYAAAYVPANGADTANAKRLIVYDKEIQWETNYRSVIRPYQLDVNADVDSIYISAKVASNNRWYVQKIEFEAENPNPSKPVIEMQYASLTFESASWLSEDEPMEDAMDFTIKGKNIDGSISLAMYKNKPFDLSPVTIPANGGDVSVSYSITMSSAPSQAISYKDSVIATAKGTDGKTYTRKLPIELTVKPQSSGASTFDLDTTRMSIGSMPGDYYKYAQGTADSTLKNHIGYIICSGRRYRYGSGSKKTWDGFFYTDRDPQTNQVLDMYSNNVRYFDPEKPTASVKDFDIEHMLPKSWWGGDVNPAYCDLFHLVPGDYSANRSKSNHAPGIPADSTFNNGSFVTGSGIAYGLTRVFCPEDQYKGDFARAYFYIAACYGDSLTWVASGEPGIAMTNDGWQEFRPWLRDLLLEWHRNDPVSQKELTRAIEVNKIQGNRNPFIDYPELVEYIWGNKQGEPVDFRTLTQSYGDQYNDTPTGCNAAEAQHPFARKVLRDGRLYVTIGEKTYSILGQ